MVFNPEDERLAGPRCRNCHRGSSGCGSCHNTSGGVNPSDALSREDQEALAAASWDYENNVWRSDITNLFMILLTGDVNNTAGKAYTMYNLTTTGDGQDNQISQHLTQDGLTGMFKKSRTVAWNANWRTSETTVSAECSDDGFSWPHRTLGWKMLKDDLFGLDFDGTAVDVGQYRSYAVDVSTLDPNRDKNVDTSGQGLKAHDLDSVCLDCHNPTVWNATSSSDHDDDLMNPYDDKDDDVLLRGLP